MNKMIFSQVKNIDISSHGKKYSRLFRNTSVVFIVTQTYANDHFFCLNACKFSVSGFSFSQLENEEQFTLVVPKYFDLTKFWFCPSIAS